MIGTIVVGGGMAMHQAATPLSERRAAVPRQLPPVLPDFTGRDSELQELLEAAAEGVAVCALVGMGGVGKSALAVRLAQELKAGFPDGQLYLNLKGSSPKPLPPAEAQAHVVRSFDQEIALPQYPDGIAGLYRTMLDGRRTLLLLEDARDSKQVEHLMPPAGSVLILTSRQHFALPGMASTELRSMPLADATLLLLRIAPRIGAFAEELAGLCACLPLALRLAGGALVEKVNLDPAYYVRRLLAARTRLTLIEASLKTSYGLLTRRMQKLWRSLSVFPDTFDDAGAAAVWDLAVDQAGDALGELINFSVVEWNRKTKRYRLHDLARIFADAKLTGDGKVAAQRRHSIHYAKVLRNANDMYNQGGNSITAGLELFDLEWTNIQAGQAWAALRLNEDEAAPILCCSLYPDFGKDILSWRRHPSEYIGWLKAALNACKVLGDSEGARVHGANLGLAYMSLGDYQRAREANEQSLTTSREAGDRSGEYAALANLGGIWLSLGNYQEAMECQHRALAIAREGRDRPAEARSMGNLANAYLALGKHRQGIELHKRCLAIFKKLRDLRGEGISLGGLGNAYYLHGDFQRAIKYSERYLAISERIGDREGRAKALGTLGIAYSSLGESRQALRCHLDALAIAREIGDRASEGNALHNLVLAFMDSGQPDEAVKYVDAAVKIREELRAMKGGVSSHVSNP